MIISHPLSIGNISEFINIQKISSSEDYIGFWLLAVSLGDDWVWIALQGWLANRPYGKWVCLVDCWWFGITFGGSIFGSSGQCAGGLPYRTTEKNRPGPQMLKFPPPRHAPNLSICPNDFSLAGNRRAGLSECEFLRRAEIGNRPLFWGWNFKIGRPSGPTHKPDAP